MEDRLANRTRSSIAAAAQVGAVVLSVAVLSAAVMFFAGCDETKHYRVLSFFFDGVPLPPELREAAEGSESGSALGAGAAEEAVEKKETVYVYHTPYKDWNCWGCHDRKAGFGGTVANEKLCGQCHESYSNLADGDWRHGPVAQGECGYCHEAHKSEHRGVLKAAQPDLCFDCHDSSDVYANPVHANIQDQPCSACHDPHSAGNRRPDCTGTYRECDSRSFLHRRSPKPREYQSRQARLSRAARLRRFHLFPKQHRAYTYRTNAAQHRVPNLPLWFQARGRWCRR